MQHHTKQGRDVMVLSPSDPQLEHAFRVAAALFARAKVEQRAPGPSLTRPVSSVFLTDDGQMFLLQGLPFCEHPAAEKDQHAVATKLIALCADAWAVADIVSGWTADRCATCGVMLASSLESCPQCGTPLAPPDANPFRRGVVLTVLHLRESSLNYAWLAEERDGDDGHVAWTDVEIGEPYPANALGRFEVPWAMNPWMVVHVVLNLPVLEQLLGHVPQAELVAEARRVEAGAPPGFRFLRFDPGRMANVIRRVAVEDLIG